MVSRTDLPANKVRVVCEAEIDAAGMVLRLVNNRILSFGKSAPRVLLLPMAGTAPETLVSLRARMTETLGAAGITVVAAETARPATADRAAATRAARDAGAHFVAETTVSPVRAPSPVGGVVLDTTIQYTLMRVYDAAIVAEQVFPAERTSGVNYEMALGRALDKLAPVAAKGLGGRLAETIFANGSVIDPEVAPSKIEIIDRTPPKVPPATERPTSTPAPETTPETRPVAAPAPAVRAEAAQPRPAPVTTPTRPAQRLVAEVSATPTSIAASAASKPLEFRLSAAFAQAVGQD